MSRLIFYGLIWVVFYLRLVKYKREFLMGSLNGLQVVHNIFFDAHSLLSHVRQRSFDTSTCSFYYYLSFTISTLAVDLTSYYPLSLQAHMYVAIRKRVKLVERVNRCSKAIFTTYKLLHCYLHQIDLIYIQNGQTRGDYADPSG